MQNEPEVQSKNSEKPGSKEMKKNRLDSAFLESVRSSDKLVETLVYGPNTAKKTMNQSQGSSLESPRVRQAEPKTSVDDRRKIKPIFL